MRVHVRTRRLAIAAFAIGAVALFYAAGGQGSPAAADEAGPRTFDTPDAAAAAAVEAASKNSDEMIKALVGAGSADVIQSGKDPLVAQARADFAKRAAESLTLADNEDGSKTIVVGHNKWPLPIPLVKTEAGWQFDGEAGREEILARRIGRNELEAIDVCRMYARAQIEYASKDRDGDEVREYAQRIRSTPGKQDGLYWDAAEGEETSPMGPFVEPMKAYLDNREAGDPFGGYVWRILTGQGPSAPGCRHSYVINGNMIAGFALVGYPATYGNTGVMTFMVSHHGKVLQKDLGENTETTVRAMRGYNPDKTWTAVEDE